MRYELSGCHTRFDAGASDFYLDYAVGQPLIADNDLERGANEISIIELDAGAIVTVIPEYVKSCCLQFGIQTSRHFIGLV